MRDDEWLQQRLDQIWLLLFPEVERKNRVIIRWHGKWKNKFGHIKMLRSKETEIVINAYFKDERIPEGVIDATIAHELIHYMHGFQSPHKQQYKHPHAGGIVTRELKRRGFGHVMALEREFIKNKWLPIYKELNNKPRKQSFLSRFF